MVMALVALFMATKLTHTAQMHPLVFRDNPWIGVVRWAFIGSVAWLCFVLAFFADPSIQGVYVLFDLVLGITVIQTFGHLGALFFGTSFRRDVVQRKNPAAAIFLSCFLFATGLLFGGSVWGEADPDGDDEGGWWIPLGFFLAGWGGLLALLGLFWFRESAGSTSTLIGDRDRWAARAAGVYTLSAAWVLTDAVAGDFHGWVHGLSAVLAVVVMLITHEIFRFAARRLGGGLRILEIVVYIAAALIIPTIGRWIERLDELVPLLRGLGIPL